MEHQIPKPPPIARSILNKKGEALVMIYVGKKFRCYLIPKAPPIARTITYSKGCCGRFS
jgi:hypothetical protein